MRQDVIVTRRCVGVLGMGVVIAARLVVAHHGRRQTEQLLESVTDKVAYGEKIYGAVLALVVVRTAAFSIFLSVLSRRASLVCMSHRYTGSGGATPTATLSRGLSARGRRYSAQSSHGDLSGRPRSAPIRTLSVAHTFES